MEIIGIGILFMIGIYLAPVVVLAVGVVIAGIVGVLQSLFGGRRWTKLKTQTQNTMNYGKI